MFGRKKSVKQIEKQEPAARKSVLEDLFYDFNRSRAQIYKMNFFRGIFFGLGSVLGGTIVIALLVYLLSLLTNIPGGVGDFVKYIVTVVQNTPSK